MEERGEMTTENAEACEYTSTENFYLNMPGFRFLSLDNTNTWSS